MNKGLFGVLMYTSGVACGVCATLIVYKLAYLKKMDAEMDKEVQNTIEEMQKIRDKQKKERDIKKKLRPTKASEIIEGPIKDDEEEEVNEVVIFPKDYYYFPDQKTEDADRGYEIDPDYEEYEESWDRDSFIGGWFRNNDEEIEVSESNDITLEPINHNDDRLPLELYEEDFYKEIDNNPHYSVSHWTLYNGPDGTKVMADDNDEPLSDEQLLNITGYDLVDLIEKNKEDLLYFVCDSLCLLVEIQEDIRHYKDLKRSMPFLSF